MKSNFSCVLAGLLAFNLMGISGCGGGGADEDLWTEAIRAHMHLDSARTRAEAGPGDMSEAYAQASRALEQALEDHRGPQGLRQFVADAAADYRRLADGEVTGAAARELEEELDYQFFHYVYRVRVPPDYE